MSAARPLPKFGEWDVSDPASAEGYTVIFNKARDEKKTGANVANIAPNKTYEAYNHREQDDKYKPKRKWFCCG